jgi:hypothetical protein
MDYKNFFALVLPICHSVSLYAGAIGNPATPELLQEGYFIPSTSWVHIRMGFEGDFLNNGRMQQKVEGKGRIDNYEQGTNSGTVTGNFLDKLDIYGVFGSARTNASWRFITPVQSTTRIETETNYAFLWAVGARALIYEWGKTILGLGGRFSQTTPTLSWLTTNGIPVPVINSKLHWREWQINLSLSHTVEIFIPYIGIKYLKSKSLVKTLPVAISESGSGALHMQNAHPVGLILGCTLTASNFFYINLEGRLIDEEAATISADIRF